MLSVEEYMEHWRSEVRRQLIATLAMAQVARQEHDEYMDQFGERLSDAGIVIDTCALFDEIYAAYEAIARGEVEYAETLIAAADRKHLRPRGLSVRGIK